MKKLLQLSLVASLALAVQLPVGAVESGADGSKPNVFLSPFKHEAVAVSLKPGWIVGKQIASPGMFILQFLPPDADPKDPKTLINVVTYPGLQRKQTPREYAKQEQSKAPDIAKPGKIEFTFIDESNPNDVIYQLSLQGNPKFPDQFEVHRVMAGKDGMHTVIYHVQPANQTKDQIAEMLAFVKTVKLVEPPKQPAAGKKK